MIYFMQAAEGGPVKIGFTDNLKGRHRTLEGHYGRQLVILATMNGDREEERGLHARFAHLRFGRTEQFRPGLELMEFIGRPLLVGANPNTIEAMASVADDDQVRIRVSPAFKEWLIRYADSRNLTMTDVIVQDLMRGAKVEGFEPPPKR